LPNQCVDPIPDPGGGEIFGPVAHAREPDKRGLTLHSHAALVKFKVRAKARK
jgi:hypothetical protein